MDPRVVSRAVGPAVVGLAVAACLSSSPADAPGASVSQAILGGPIDTSDAAVVAIVRAGAGVVCSGVIIASDVVLTAAHCVYGVNAADLQVVVGTDVATPDRTVAVSAVAAYPTYAGSAGIAGGIDLGALTLASSPGVTPIPIDTSTRDADFQQGAHVTLVGYGDLDAAQATGAGVRRQVTVPVTSICSRLLTAGNAAQDACFDDSGDAAILQGVDALVAIVTAPSPDCAGPSSLTRLDAHADWIASVIAGHASSPCAACVAPDSSCAASVEAVAADGGEPGESGSGGGGCVVPAPGPARGEDAAIATLGVLALGLTRRRRRG